MASELDSGSSGPVLSPGEKLFFHSASLNPV